MSNNFVKPILYSTVTQGHELHVLKWVLHIKHSLLVKQKGHHRERLVRSSKMWTLSHSVAGNAHTTHMAAYRAISSIMGSSTSYGWRSACNSSYWCHQSSPPDQSITTSHDTQTTTWILRTFQELIDHLWQTIWKLYGEVKAERYWKDTFITYFTKNISNPSKSLWNMTLRWSMQFFGAPKSICKKKRKYRQLSPVVIRKKLRPTSMKSISCIIIKR